MSLAEFMVSAHEKQVPVQYHNSICLLIRLKVDDLAALRVVSAGCMHTSSVLLKMRLEQIFSHSSATERLSFGEPVALERWIPLERGRVILAFNAQMDMIDSLDIQENAAKWKFMVKWRAGFSKEMEAALEAYKGNRNGVTLHEFATELPADVELKLKNYYH